MKQVQLEAIELDASIQCRATIDTSVVGDYAERMEAGDSFPPVDLFGTVYKCWIGDGWHRVMAAAQLGRESIEAVLHPGGRAEALKHALGANTLHGHRRSNADKRRCVEIALREFPKLSSRAVAKLCGVSHVFAESLRPQVETLTTSERTGQDGKQYPAHREPALAPAVEQDDPKPLPEPLRKIGPPRDGLEFARLAIMDLEQIRQNDVERDAAFERVIAWISEHWEKRG